MAKSNFLFRTITEDLLDKMEFSQEEILLFYFDNNRNYTEIKFEIENNEITISNDELDWDIKKYELCICLKGSFKNASNLFHGSDAIACENSKIGICISWNSPSIRNQGNSQLFIIEDKNESQSFSLTQHFSPKEIRGKINISLSLVLLVSEKSGVPGIADIPGTRLGNINEYTLLLEGTASYFPTYLVQEPNKPLWYMVFNYENPAEDSFMETVSLCLNQSHPDYIYLEKRNPSFCPRLENEILAEAISSLLIHLKEENELDNINDNNEIIDGSVLSVARYIIVDKQIDISQAGDQIAALVRSEFERENKTNE